jgi:hypothetical protein
MGLTRARLGEHESTSIDDLWESITVLASSPLEMSPLQPDPPQPRLTPGLHLGPQHWPYHAPAALPPPAEGVQDHPWVVLPFLASVQLLEGLYDKRNPCLSPLADFVREFMRNGDIRGFADLEAEVVFHFTHNPGGTHTHTHADGTHLICCLTCADVGMHHAMFVVAWWARLLCIDEREGRSRAAYLLRLVLPAFAQFDSKLAVPIVELLRSCEFVRTFRVRCTVMRAVCAVCAVCAVVRVCPRSDLTVAALRPIQVGTTLLPPQTALNLQVAFGDWRKQESEWSSPDPCPPHLKHTVGKILFHANQAISLENTCERAQSAELLVSGVRTLCPFLVLRGVAVTHRRLDCYEQLMSASQPLLAVSLHELDCRGMLVMVVNVLHGLRHRRDQELVSLPELLEVRVVSCRAMPNVLCTHCSSVMQRVKEFEGLYVRLHNAFARVTAPHGHYRAPTTLPLPQDQLVMHVPLLELTAAPLSEAKIERLDSDDQQYFSTPTSPLSNTTAPPPFSASSAATSPFFPQHTLVPGGHHYVSSPSSSPSFAHGHAAALAPPLLPHPQHHHNGYPPWPVMPQGHPLLQPPPHPTYFPPPPFSHCPMPVPPEWSAPSL